MQNAFDVEKATADERREAEQRVMFPESRTDMYKFLGKELRLRALPIFYAKKIGGILAPFNKEISTALGGNEASASALLDESTTDALVDSTVVICEFYKAGLTKDDIEREASIEDLLDFVRAQLDVNGASDFLLLPLRVITKLGSLVRTAASQMDQVDAETIIQSSLPTPPSAKPGE